jgi:hypothetical protein
MKKLLIIGIFLLNISLVPALEIFDSSSFGQAEPEYKTSIELGGYVRGSAFGLSEDFDYSSLFGEFSLQGKLVDASAFLYADVRIRSGIQFGDEFTSFQLKEGYAGYSADRLDILLGNQIVTWGRTDGFNPTNNITPNDYFFLTAEPDDQKLSNFMLRIKYRLTSEIDLDVVGIPYYAPSVYRYDLFDMGENVKFRNVSLPEKTFKNGTVAAKLNVELSKLGFSLSYFRGYDPFAGFNVDTIDWSTGIPSITNSAAPYLKNTLGADLALPIGRWMVRGEFAYNRTEGYKNKFYVPNPDLSYVAGIENNFGGFNIIAQYIGTYTISFNELVEPELLDPTNPMSQMEYANGRILYKSAQFDRKIFYQQEKTNHALSLTVSKSLAYETWNIEMTGYYNLTSDDYMLRPKITWKITDALSASIGGSYMDGPVESLFDYSGPVLNGCFLELKASF